MPTGLIGIIFTLLLLGQYAATWQQSADSARSALTEQIASFNEHRHRFDQHHPYLRYRRITAGGFPLMVNLTIEEPSLQVPVSALIRANQDRFLTSISTDADARLPKKWFEYFDAHAITLSTAIATPGDITTTMIGPLTETTWYNHRIHYRAETRARLWQCDAHGLMPTSKLETSDRLRGLLERDSSLQCTINGATMIDPRNTARLSKVDQLSFALQSTAAADGKRHHRKLDLQYSDAGVQTFTANDAHDRELYAIYAAVFHSKIPRVEIPASAYGDANHAVKMSYEGALGKHLYGALPLHFDISEAITNDALSHSHMQAHIAFDPSLAQNSEQVSLHARTDYTAAYAELIRPPAPQSQAGKTAMAASRACPAELAAVCTFYANMQYVSADIEASGDVLSQHKSRRAVSRFQVAQFALDTQPFGLALHGAVSGSRRSGGPDHTNVALRLRNADLMITTIATILARTQMIHAVPESAAAVPHYQEFLSAIALDAPKTRPDLIFTLTQKPGGPLLLSNLTMERVNTIYHQIFDS